MEKKNDRSDKFQWGDGDLQMIYNPNDKKRKQKEVFIMDGTEWEQELQMAAHSGEDDDV